MSGASAARDNPRVKSGSCRLREGLFMLQWKPRFYAILTLAALAIAVFGGYAGDAGDTLRQFGW
jgi:hypothetical protein